VPIYDYVCSNCHRLTEVVRGIDAEGPRFCPECGAEGTMTKVFSAPSVHFKGTGWAKKDRGSSSRSARKKEESGTASGDGSTDGSTDAGSKAPGDSGPTESKKSDKASPGSSSRDAGSSSRDAGSGGSSSSSSGSSGSSSGESTSSSGSSD
jgi:putative FmdB family regulatory protein